jgi:hypothetical protein
VPAQHLALAWGDRGQQLGERGAVLVSRAGFRGDRVCRFPLFID